MRPEHLDLLRSCADPALTPDGHHAVVPVLRPDTATDEYVGSLWLVRTDGTAPPRPLSRGHRDTSPAVSPDGRAVAFLRAERKGRPQLHVVPLGGGEPVRLTDAPLGVGAPVWAPDSRRLAWSARVPEEGRYGTDPDVSPDAEPPRLVTRPAYRTDGLGYTVDRRQHLFVLDLSAHLHEVGLADGPGWEQPGPDAATPLHERLEPVQVTDGDHDDTSPAWSPDGARLAFVSDRHEGRERDLRRHAYVLDLDPSAGGDGPQPVTAGDLTVLQVAWSGAEQLVALAMEVPGGTDFVARNPSLWSVGADGDDARRLTDPASIDLNETTAPLTVTERGVLVQDRTRGAVRVLEVDPDGGEVDAASARVVSGGHRRHRSVAATADGSVVVAVVADPGTAGDLEVLRAPGLDGAPRRLTDVGAALRAQTSLRPLVEVDLTADDGYPLHGWVVLPDPERYGPGPHPVLLDVHGGPYGDYGWGLFDEAQVYAGAGYAVVLANPRGSAGYGEAHGRVIRGAMGGRDADDLLQLLDGVLTGDLPLDAGRVGVMGGSYGGYMTAWLTTRTDRFVAAVVERGYLDPVSFVGSSDIGWFFPAQYHGDGDGLRDQSPMTYVDRVTTPTLVIHSEADWRTPVEQGQRWFTALQLQGVESELLLFPGEGHELTRSGRPRHRVARFEHLLRWWARHLPTAPRPDDASAG
ncbi:S9 family peptidase [Thalassiella azotivora]